ncbi:MAG: hypothetical protein JKY32_07830 [Rhizobiales bacterium]|nr:hypothetical protein [Hyphomicrobiales bacterium]
MNLEQHTQQALVARLNETRLIKQFLEREKHTADQAMAIEEMRFAGFKKAIAILDESINSTEQALNLCRELDEAAIGSGYEEPY